MSVDNLPAGFKYTATKRHAVYYRKRAHMLFSAVATGDTLRVEWFCSDNGSHLGDTTARNMAAAIGPGFTVNTFGMALIASLGKRLGVRQLIIFDAHTPLRCPASSYGTF